MQRFLLILGHWLHGLAFATWFGGILAIGAFVAPSAFHTNRLFAGTVVGESLQKLNLASFICAGIMLGATWIEAQARSERARRLLFVRAVLTAAALAMGLYLGIRLFPMMIHMRTEGQMTDFTRLHSLYEAVTQVQFWLLAAGGLLTAFLAVPRTRGSGVQAGSTRSAGTRSGVQETPGANEKRAPSQEPVPTPERPKAQDHRFAAVPPERRERSDHP
jgi:hypothetical protein